MSGAFPVDRPHPDQPMAGARLCACGTCRALAEIYSQDFPQMALFPALDSRDLEGRGDENGCDS